MNVLIVYDSYFGNTEKVAKHIGNVLKNVNTVNVINVRKVDIARLQDIDLLIVGSPTRAFQPTPAIKGFLEKLPKYYLRNMKTAAFDTRISIKDTNITLLGVLISFFGYANKIIAKMLNDKGGKSVANSEGFYVEGSKGPLKEGELERASVWVKTFRL